MPLNQADREEIKALIAEEFAGAWGKATLCRAEYPHEGKLRYHRGPNVYVCECGQRYIKDGAGGLRDAPVARPALAGGL